MDFLDFLTIKDEEVLSGNYYEEYPMLPSDTYEPFQYDIVEETDRTYAKLLDAIKEERTVCTIKTNDNCGFKINGYIATQDGLFWQITGIVKRLIKEDNKQALRILKQSIETEYIIRLIGVDNPKGLK